MNNLKVSLALVLLGFSAFSNASDYVDPVQKSIDVKRDKIISDFVSKCGKVTVGCKMDAESKAEDAAPSRGTARYSKNAYGNLSVAQAKIKLKELINLYSKVSDQRSGSWEGRVSKEQIEKETMWIMRHKLNQMSPDINSAKMYLNMPL